MQTRKRKRITVEREGKLVLNYGTELSELNNDALIENNITEAVLENGVTSELVERLEECGNIHTLHIRDYVKKEILNLIPLTIYRVILSAKCRISMLTAIPSHVRIESADDFLLKAEKIVYDAVMVEELAEENKSDDEKSFTDKLNEYLDDLVNVSEDHISKKPRLEEPVNEAEKYNAAAILSGLSEEQPLEMNAVLAPELPIVTENKNDTVPVVENSQASLLNQFGLYQQLFMPPAVVPTFPILPVGPFYSDPMQLLLIQQAMQLQQFQQTKLQLQLFQQLMQSQPQQTEQPAPTTPQPKL